MIERTMVQLEADWYPDGQRLIVSFKFEDGWRFEAALEREVALAHFATLAEAVAEMEGPRD